MAIRFAHSPDADDAFMFYALAEGKIDRGPIEFEEVREDIQTLNRRAREGTYEVSAVSIHALPQIADKYGLITTGACFGNQYGPVIVANRPLKPRQILKLRMGIPGKETTAFLVMQLWTHKLAGAGKSGICFSEVSFDQIMDQTVSGKIDVGLIIHEGQLSFAEKGLYKVIDLGEWWYKETSLPLPLGGIVVRRDLDESLQAEIVRLMQESIRYALEHKDEALEYALPYARGLDKERAAQFIGMYVNEMTVDFGRKGRRAIKALFDRGYKDGIIGEKVILDDLFLKVKKSSIPAEPSYEPLPSPSPTEEPPSAPSPVEEIVDQSLDPVKEEDPVQ